MKKIIINEKQKKKIKDVVKVHHDVMLGVAAGDMAGICEGVEEETITLYHGVSIKGLEFNLEHGGFIPRVCSEGGPKAVWLSEKQYGYPFIFQFDIPKSMVSQLSNVDYIYEDAISFDDFNCHLVNTNIRVHYDSFTVVLNILDDDLSKRQFAMFKDLGVVLWKEFKDYPMVLDEYINPFIENHQSLEEEEIKDEYKLAPEQNDITPYYHVVDEAKNYNMNEIGGVNCQLNFDEDEYEEWLNDNELQNIPEVKNQFIKDYCTYSIEYLTPETFHGFDYDDLSYDEIINKFGQNMGMAMINDCMDGREHSFETLEYVEDTPVDLSNPNEVNAAAKKYMRTVDNPGGVRGFILTDGTVVDAG